MAPYTSIEEVDAAHSTLIKTFKSGKTKSVAWRKWQLKQIWWMVLDNEKAIIDALHTDLHRHDFESYLADIRGIRADILGALAHVDEWAADEIPDAGFLFGTLCGARIRQEPLGVALLMGTWNCPFVMTLSPLIAAISAGCCAMVKPSEITVASQDLMIDLIPKYMDQEAIIAVSGGPKESGLILERRFDHIFYTGSIRVGKIVQAAAARHLTPTVLELGGQVPVIVTSTANIDIAAKRVAFAKYFNAGQICLSPNHVFIDPSVHDKFVEKTSQCMKQFLSAAGKEDLVHIVNERNFGRIEGLLSHTKGKIAYGGDSNKETRYIQPTICTDLDMSDSLMSEEIFGPLLPVMKIDYRRACEVLKTMEHPLGLYIFSSDQKEIDEILSKTQSGGVTINDVMMHASVPNAPFGGVGNSGTGAYHGKYGFDAFTHRRTVVSCPAWLEYLFSFRYPPYSSKNISKVISKNDPGFKRGESMADQAAGAPFGDYLMRLLRIGVKVAGFAVVLALLDTMMGGQSRLMGVLRSSFAGMRSTLGQ